MSMYKRFGALAVLGSMSVAASVGFPGEASAAAECKQGQICFYEHFNQTGSVLKFQDDLIDLASVRFNNGHSANRAISSVHNNSNSTVVMYISTSCLPGGSHGGGGDGTVMYDVVSPGERRNLAPQFNENISSICFSF